MKKANILLTIGLFCLLFFSCKESSKEIPSTAVILGEVVNVYDGAPVSNAEVGLCYHETSMLKEGLFVGGTACEIPDTIAYTDEKGNFSLPALVDRLGTPTYVWIRVKHPDFETTHEVFVHVKPGENAFGILEMRERNQFQKWASKNKKNLSSKRSAFKVKKGSIFIHSKERLKKVFPPHTLRCLPSIQDLQPKGGYVRYCDPVRGYNERPSQFDSKKWDAYETLLLPMDLAMAGVTEGEIGGFTDHPDALMTQAIWARTYALYRGMHERTPQNFQMAFKTTLDDRTLRAGIESSGMILSHLKAPGGFGNPIEAVFSARCNGDFTQPAHAAKWGGCKLSGNRIPYLLSVACSHHTNCNEGGMSSGSCCEIVRGKKRYIYGHGAGGCQHGLRDYTEEKGWPYAVVAPYYFHGSTLRFFDQDVWRGKS